MRLLSWLLVNVLALAAAAWLFDGISIEGATWQDKLPNLLVVGIVLGLLGSFVKPIVKLLSLPFIILTLGLLLLVINAVFLLAAAAIGDAVGYGISVDSFLVAIGGGLVIAIASSLLGGLLDDE